jgi:hypothetical protein
LSSIIKVDQIQSDTGSIVYPSNVSLGNTSVTNFGSTGVNARLHIEGVVNLNDGQAVAFGGGTSRPSLSGNKSAGTLGFGVGGGSPKMILYGTGSDTTQGYLDLPVGQLKFPASQNASADANTLDDYEEGTWTPADTSGAGLSLSVNDAKYIKIGKMVQCYAQVTYPSTANGAQAQIGGLPFITVAMVGNGYGAFTVYSNYDEAFWMNTSGGSGTIAHNLAGSAVTNANISGKQFRLVWSYEALN